MPKIVHFYITIGAPSCIKVDLCCRNLHTAAVYVASRNFLSLNYLIALIALVSLISMVSLNYLVALITLVQYFYTKISKCVTTNLSDVSTLVATRILFIKHRNIKKGQKIVEVLEGLKVE